MRLRLIVSFRVRPARPRRARGRALRLSLAAVAIGCAAATLTAQAPAVQAHVAQARIAQAADAKTAFAAAQAGAAKPAPAKPAPAQPGTKTPAKPAPATSAAGQPAGAKPAASSDAGPVVTMETAKGTIVFQLYAQDAPKSVDHIVKLVKSSFYRSQRIIRIVPGQLVQFGDKQSRDMTRREWWGRGLDSGSGQPIGAAEFSKTRKFKLGTVGLAHSGDPRAADSQMFFALRAIPEWNGKYVIIGQVTSGLDVLPKLKVEDLIKLVTVTDAK